MTNHDFIKSLFEKSLTELASDPARFAVVPGRDFTRNRKINLSDTLRILLTMEGRCIKEELYCYFGRTVDAPSKSALYKQRQKLSESAFPTLFSIFNRKLPRNLFRNKYQLIACDGSSAYIPRNPDDVDTFFEKTGKTDRGFNLIHINAAYSIMDKRFTNLVIQPGRKQNEIKAFCEIVDSNGRDESPIIYIADMGYACYNTFAHVIENNQFFMIRCNDQRLAQMLGRPVDNIREMDISVSRILSRTQSQKKRSRTERSGDYRYISRPVTFEYLPDDESEYDISLRIVRFEIATGVFENIITNLPDDEFGIDDFKDIYHLRWDEETAFRDLKYSLCLNDFHSKKYEYIIQEIWARAILYNFSSSIITGVEIEKKDTCFEYQANFSAGLRICRDFLRIRDTKKRLDVSGLIKQNIEPIRPDRSFPRRKRFGIPVCFCYRK